MADQDKGRFLRSRSRSGRLPSIVLMGKDDDSSMDQFVMDEIIEDAQQQKRRRLY